MPQARSNQLAEEADVDVAPIGHNKPPSPVELLAQELAETYGAEMAKADPLAERANAAPDVIGSEADLSIIAAIGVEASKLYKALEAARLNEKRPVVAAVDGYFEPATTRLSRIATAMTQRATKWQQKVAADARAKQAEEDAQRRREADAARDAARIAAEFDDVDGAVDAAGTAAAVEAQIAATPQPSAADLTRTRTESGVLATTRTAWDFEVADMSKVDLNALRAFIDPKAVRTAIGKIVRVQKGDTKIEGVRVFQTETAQLRG